MNEGVQIRLDRHTATKVTRYGSVEQDLGQDKVFILNDETGKYTHCGYVGPFAFLPLCGFPKELVETVTQKCSAEVGRELYAGKVPLSYAQMQEILKSRASGSVTDSDDFEGEDE